jgi:hypothetical protein
VSQVRAFIEDDLQKEFHEYLEKGPKGHPYLDIFDYPDRDAIELKLIQISDKYKGQGYGTAIMNKLTKWADRNNKIIVLSPSEIKTNKLIKWYKEFDFLENKGRNKDFRFMNRMIRYPKGLTRSKWIDENQKANASPSLYNLIEYGGGEFSKEQLEEFDKKPTLTESSSLEYVRNKYYNGIDKDHFYNILNKLLLKREKESFVERHMNKDQGEGELKDVQNSYRYLFGNHPSEVDKSLRNYTSDFDMGTNSFASTKREMKFKLETEPGQRRAMLDMLDDLSNMDMVNIGRVYRYNTPGKSILEVHIKEANEKAYKEIKSYLSIYLELDDTVDVMVDREFVTDRPTTVALDIPNKDKNLGIPRRNMPQIKKKHFDKFIEFLKDDGVDVKEVRVSPLKLKPTQNEFNMGKVQLMMGPDKDKLKKPLLISSDNYILDGHHKWLANLNLDEKKPVKCIKVDLNARDFFAKAKEFDKVRYKDINDNTFKETDPKLAYASTPFEKALEKVKKSYEEGGLVGFMSPLKYEDDIRSEIGSLNGKPIYRAVRVNEEGQLDPKKIGIYWTWDIDKAVAYWGTGDVKITLETVATDSIIDWESTIEQWLKPQYAGECEVRLKPKAQLDINTIWIGKSKQHRKFTAVAESDTTHKDGFEHLERRTDFNVGQDFLNELVENAQIIVMKPDQLKKVGTVHRETFFDHSDRKPITEEEAIKLLGEVSEPMILKWKGRMYALDGQHRINTAIKLDLPLSIKVIDGRDLDDFETYGYETKAVYPHSSRIDKPTIDKVVIT